MLVQFFLLRKKKNVPMSEIAKCALKTSLVGAGLGLVVGVVQGVCRQRGGATTPTEAGAAAVAAIQGSGRIEKFDSEMYHNLVELGSYNKYNSSAFARIGKNINNIIEKYEEAQSDKSNPGTPYAANRFVAHTVEAVRELRKKVEHACPTRLADFDEHAAKIQETLNNWNYNIIMDTQEKLNA